MATVASTISGREVELPGMWNRMFAQRVLTDYGPEGFAAISALPGGESLEWCYGCGKCVPVCPVSAIFALDDLPEKWNSFTELNAKYFGR